MPMQKIVSLAFFLFVFGYCLNAHAETGHWGLDYWESQRPYTPYIQDPIQTQNQQWANDPWQPADWAVQRKGNAKEQMKRFYQADIIRKQYVKDERAAIDVGPAFYELGGQDQQRVAAFIDETYGVTKNKLYGMYTLYDWNTHRAIGTYTQYGLTMK
jgi:hypothetical protein